jgi:hypothetical protein
MPAPSGPQFDFLKFPKPFGTTPIPEGHVRFNHHTWPRHVESIRNEGLRLRAAEESYSTGGTEFPATFATAGAPHEEMLSVRPVVEFHAHPDNTSLGWPTPTPRTYPPDDIELWEKRGSVATLGDVPPENIINIHEPWHQTYRYIVDDPSMERGVMRGDYDTSGDKDTQKAVDISKIPLAAKVMLGGRLEGRE